MRGFVEGFRVESQKELDLRLDPRHLLDTHSDVP